MAARAVSLAEQNGFATVFVTVFHNPSCAVSRGAYENLRREILERYIGVQITSDFVELNYRGQGEFISVCACMCVRHSGD